MRRRIEAVDRAGLDCRYPVPSLRTGADGLPVSAHLAALGRQVLLDRAT
jgi:hypothetical protein